MSNKKNGNFIFKIAVFTEFLVGLLRGTLGGGLMS